MFIIWLISLTLWRQLSGNEHAGLISLAKWARLEKDEAMVPRTNEVGR